MFSTTSATCSSRRIAVLKPQTTCQLMFRGLMSQIRSFNLKTIALKKKGGGEAVYHSLPKSFS